MVESIQILIAKYPDMSAAEIALDKVFAARENQGVEIRDAAVVSRAEDGKLHIHETEDVTGGRGAAVGGILGAVLGILAGPAGVVAGAAVGAAVGGVAAKAIDTGIPHKRLEEIGNSLKPQGAALVVLTEAGFLDFIQTLIGGEGVEFMTESMSTQAAQELGHEHDVALKALKMGDALAEGGMASPTPSDQNS
jgi:uncharacterized membrane protein